MIKKFKLYILMAAVALSATSCLDKMPEDSIPFDDAIQTVDDVNLAVIGIYDAFLMSIQLDRKEHHDDKEDSQHRSNSNE